MAKLQLLNRLSPLLKVSRGSSGSSVLDPAGFQEAEAVRVEEDAADEDEEKDQDSPIHRRNVYAYTTHK